MLAAQQMPGVSAAPAAWQNPQAAAPMYAATAAVPGQVSPGQMPSWNQSAQAATPTYVSAAGSYPQTYSSPPVPAYATTQTPAGSSPLSRPVTPVTQPGAPANMRPGGVSPPGNPPYYVR